MALAKSLGDQRICHAQLSTVNCQPTLCSRSSVVDYPRQEGATYLLVVSGIGGEERYRAAFIEWGSALVKAAVEQHGMPRENVIFLTEQPERAPEWASGKATKDELEKAVASLAGRASAGDQVMIVLLGHGSFQAGESRFNLSGPNVSADDFAVLLSSFRGPRVAVVNAASASGEFIKALAAENRVIVTATKSGQERNATVFGKYFTEAFASDGADTDKDGRVSLLEAFTFARLQVEREYKEGNRLLTEHAVLDDTGAGSGSSDPDVEQGEGVLAGTMFLGAGTVTAAPADASPALRSLYDEKRNVERQLAELRARRSSMEAAAYDERFEQLMIELARVDREIRTMEGRR